MNARIRAGNSIQNKKTALIADGNSALGRNTAVFLETMGNWNIIITSPQKLHYTGAFEFIRLDGFNMDVIDQHQEKLQEITHIFFGTADNKSHDDLDSLDLVIEIEKITPWLEHIIFIQETARYKKQNAISRLIATGQEELSAFLHYFYVSSFEEESLIQKSTNKKWGWTSLRSNAIIDIYIDNYSNIATQIAIYATICKELGIPMRFPGSEETYNARVDITALEILKESMQYVLSQNSCKGEIFNITDGNDLRWIDLWRQISDYFHIQAGKPKVYSLGAYMQTRKSIWQKICKKYKLNHESLFDSLNWSSCDSMFSDSYDLLSDPDKIHRFGFNKNQPDSFAAFRRMFDQLKENQVIPMYADWK
jgi:hypothetical protein